MLGLVTSPKMTMIVVGVLIFAVPQSAPPNENLTIPSILVLSDEFWYPLQCRELLVPLLFEDLRELFLLLCTQVAPIMVPLACSSQDFADESD